MIGAIDCTHIRITSVVGKTLQGSLTGKVVSVNVQVICDASMRCQAPYTTAAFSFPCICGTLRLKLKRSLMRIIAVAVLHNIRIQRGDILYDEDSDDDDTDSEDDMQPENNPRGNRLCSVCVCCGLFLLID